MKNETHGSRTSGKVSVSKFPSKVVSIFLNPLKICFLLTFTSSGWTSLSFALFQLHALIALFVDARELDWLCVPMINYSPLQSFQQVFSYETNRSLPAINVCSISFRFESDRVMEIRSIQFFTFNSCGIQIIDCFYNEMYRFSSIFCRIVWILSTTNWPEDSQYVSATKTSRTERSEFFAFSTQKLVVSSLVGETLSPGLKSTVKQKMFFFRTLVGFRN